MFQNLPYGLLKTTETTNYPIGRSWTKFRMTFIFITSLFYCFLLSFPSVVVGNLLFVVVVSLHNDRSPTETLGDDDQSRIAVISSYDNREWPEKGLNKIRRSFWTCFRIYILGSSLLSKKSYWKVSVQYLLFSSFWVTTDPGLQLSRMTTTTIQKINAPIGRSWNLLIDPVQKPYGGAPSGMAASSEWPQFL